jgi:hypothetical protein
VFFVKWFAVGVLVTALCLGLYLAWFIKRATDTSPGIGAVSFSIAELVMWFVVGGPAIQPGPRSNFSAAGTSPA